MNMHYRVSLAIFLASCVMWYFCHSYYGYKHTTHDTLTIVCTTGMIADAVRAIGRQHVSVHCLMSSGIDPHVYRAREGDMHRLAEADIIFYNGLHLEGKMAHILEHMDVYTKAYAVTDGIVPEKLRKTEEFTNTYDPHVWLDVMLWSDCVRFIGNKLAAFDPAHAQHFMYCTRLYCDELYKLHHYVVHKAESIPLKKRILVTDHDAFGYFGMRYGFKVVGLQGISTESEVGIKDITDLVDLLVTHKIPALFVESSISQRSIEAVQCAARARGCNVAIGQELFSDALGNPGTPQAAYTGMIRYNIDAIVDSLL